MLEEQQNNPLHGVKLEALLTELVDHYGWETLASVLNLNCFKSNPSIKSSLKFLRKTQWAREKVEGFYLYKFKRLPKPDDAQYALPPRDRNVPLQQKPRSPAVITASSVESGGKPPSSAPGKSRATSRPSATPKPGTSPQQSTTPRQKTIKTPVADVWSNWKKKSD